jgi:inhibitor of KinA sporulation pathway (predicted exonuclease)
MNKIHCCIDLELEQPKTNSQTPDSLLDEEKIIQVGYVIYQLEPTFTIIKTVREFVDIGVPISSFIKQLTGITDEDIASGTTLEDIYNEMIKDLNQYNFSRGIKQWGGGDMDCLQKELPSVKWEFGRSGVNIKHVYQMYAESNGLNPSGGLARSMAKCGLKWQGKGKHDALIDAVNTARFHHFLHTQLKKAE